MLMRDAIEETIDEAIKQGIVDTKLHSAPLEAVRLLARKADVMADGDNVTLPTMLKYLGALHIVDVPQRGRPKKERPADDEQPGKMDGMRGRLYGKLRAV